MATQIELQPALHRTMVSQPLALPPRKLAQAMVSLGEWEDALFQNSPWSWAWN